MTIHRFLEQGVSFLTLKMLHELTARLIAFLETTQHRAGHHAGVFFLYPSHHRAHVGAFDDHGYTSGL